MVNTVHVECLQDTQEMMYTDNQNVYLGPRRKAWGGEADLRTVSAHGFWDYRGKKPFLLWTIAEIYLSVPVIHF